MLVFHDTFELAPANADVISVVGGGPMFQRELRASQIEIITPVCGSAGEVMRHLVAARRQLVDATRGSIRLLAAGTHPLSSDSGEISAGERYRQIEDEYAWAVRRSLVCGLHVHVAVGQADRALAVFNALRSYLPEIAAISANSPFLDGEDTGLCSIRPKLSEALPRTGVPPEFASWEPFVAYVGWGRRGGLFPDASFLWWDLRPHPAHGTLELRVADCQTRVEDAAAILALVHCLVVWLGERHADGEALPVHPTHWIAENSWRALRYGVSGQLVDLSSGRREPTRERIASLVDRLEETGRRLGCRDELAGVRVLIAGNGSDRQRYVADREGMPGLLEWLARESDPTPIIPSEAPAARRTRAHRA